MGRESGSLVDRSVYFSGYRLWRGFDEDNAEVEICVASPSGGDEGIPPGIAEDSSNWGMNDMVGEVKELVENEESEDCRAWLVCAGGDGAGRAVDTLHAKRRSEEAADLICGPVVDVEEARNRVAQGGTST